MIRKTKFFLFMAIAAFVAVFYTWLGSYILTPSLPSPGDPALFYSNQARQDLKLTLLEAISQAKKSIYLVIFGLTDPAIVKALQEKSQNGVKVKVYYDPGGSIQLNRFLTLAETIPVQNVGLMHQKILVIDNQLVFLGSANMTPTSLAMHDNLVFGFHNKQLAEFLVKNAPGEGRSHTFHIGGQTLDLWLLPDPRGHALYSIRKTIEGASRSIQIAMFTFTHMGLVDSLISAHRKKIQVTVIIDRQTCIGASKKAVDALKKAGIEVLVSPGPELLHHKFMMVDERILISGSANWTKSAFYNNHDCFITLHNLNPDQKSFMRGLWDRVETISTPL